jgi:hypothetical protein
VRRVPGCGVDRALQHFFENQRVGSMQLREALSAGAEAVLLETRYGNS